MSQGTDRDRPCDEPLPDQPSTDPEVPEADAAEQHRPVVPRDGDDETVSVRHEVPEADAIEQATEIGLEEEEQDRD